MMKPRNGSQQSGTFKINQFLSVWGLALAIALGAILRFWNLDLKPLWMDEAITLLFALGHRYEDLPREVLIPLQDWLSVLDWQPQSCAAIAQTVNQQSTHPPLFFCAMHQWMGWWHQSGMELRWQVRSLSALAGTAAIAALYLVNRVAFSHRAGLWAAGLMAVSPFAVYLSQEGRHYTLPMLIIALSLIPTVQLGTAHTNRDRLVPLLAWVGLSSLGFYVHYFCLLAFGAEALALAAVLWRQRSALGVVSLGIVGIGLSLWPWMPQLLAHTQRPETDWLQFNAALGPSWLEPLLRLLAGCIVTVVMFPVENQPLPIVILNGLLMLGFVVYLCATLWRHRRKLFSLSQRPCSAQVLSYVLLACVGEYLVLVYGLHKDLTLAFRYNFVFYPVLCAL
ncbi:MAG TPA: glycosyltransferase family 39 protein, partial [Stenomitos sp.]